MGENSKYPHKTSGPTPDLVFSDPFGTIKGAKDLVGCVVRPDTVIEFHVEHKFNQHKVQKRAQKSAK